MPLSHNQIKLIYSEDEETLSVKITPIHLCKHAENVLEKNSVLLSSPDVCKTIYTGKHFVR
jgi:hypothetical protein